MVIPWYLQALSRTRAKLAVSTSKNGTQKSGVKFPFAWTDSSKPSPTNVLPLMITVSSTDARKERVPISVYGELKNITIGFRAITFKHCRLNDEEHNGEGV